MCFVKMLHKIQSRVCVTFPIEVWILRPTFYENISPISSFIRFAMSHSCEWRSPKGKTVDAEFISQQDGKVTLKRNDTGKEVTLKVSVLIEEDQDYLFALPGAVPKDDEEKDVAKANGGGATDLDANYDDPWPEISAVEGDVEIALVEQDKERQRFVYHSPHYEFVCDVRLNKSLVGRFAKMFEATFEAMVDLPLNFERARKFDEAKRFPIALFETKDTYISNGGPPDSAGVYMGGKNLVMVPLSSLGVRPLGSGYIIDRDVSNKTLVHELVHQLTDHIYYAPGARGWFTEGLAEYVAVTSYKSGRIKFRGNMRDIIAYATNVSRDFGRGRMLGTDIRVGNLEKYMLQDYGRFTSNANFNYGVGLLITTWLIHMDDDGNRGNLTAFMKAMKAGKKGKELLEVLRNGRSWEELEEEIAKDWKKKGKIKFHFSK